MSLIFGPQQLRYTSRMNIFVLLLTLFVVSGHCSIAMAQVAMPELQQPSVQHAAMDHHCGEISQTAPDDGNGSCWDDHCPESVTPLQAQSHKQSKQDLDAPQLWAAVSLSLPFARAGPCGLSVSAASFDFSSPPLYYSLCVLRL
ncbi:hypothetical protein [Motiliproteus sp. SC1-56]|uniref:hypothetical protein n=1 Tax=Motiliproteus sp. SC1-56 TaxID=2799565 RepID=UPI001A8FAACB|nr:hypothetical protein [Motiliproteus sp. SC1-56]